MVRGALVTSLVGGVVVMSGRRPWGDGSRVVGVRQERRAVHRIH